jgi:hypothetical protein
MAIPCQGFTLTWGGQTLQEVQSLEIDAQRGLPIGRTVTWTPNFGTLRIAAFATAHLPESEYGRRKRLTFSGRTATGGSAVTFFDRDCIYEDARIEATANDAIRFAFTFRIQDTVNAPSNP